MNTKQHFTVRLFCRAWIIIAILVPACTAQSDISGVWVVDKERSSDLEPWRDIHLRITADADQVAIGRLFNPRRYTRHDSVSFPTDNTQIEVPMEASAKWLEQPHLGIFIDGKTPQQIRANWEQPGRELNVQHLLTVQTSQGAISVEILRNYSLSDDGSELTIVETRSSRKDPLTFVFTRQ